MPGCRLNEPAESIGSLYKDLVKENLGHVRAFLCEADFLDVGTPADYLDACLSIGKAEGDFPQIGRGSIVDRTARLIDTVVWDDAVVGKDAILDRCVVADGVKILSGARFRNCAMIQRDGKVVTTDIG